MDLGELAGMTPEIIQKVRGLPLALLQPSAAAVLQLSPVGAPVGL